MVNKVDANFTGLRYSKEVVGLPGVLPGEKGNLGEPIWRELEPNSYSDFGAEVTTTARSPITAGRQKKKGRVTDLDASGGFQLDFTGDNMVDLIDTFMFADWRAARVASNVASVDADQFFKEGAFVGFAAGDIVFAKGFDGGGNNGYHRLTAASANNITVAEVMTVEAGTVTPADLRGYRFTLTIDADVNNAYPAAVVINFTASAGATVDTVGPALVTLLLANTPVVTATYTAATDVIEIAAGENAGASAITMAVRDADGYLLTTSSATVDAPAAAATARNIDLTPVVPVAYVQYSSVKKVGVQSAVGDLDVDVTDPLYPALTSTTLDFTTLGLIPGQWVYRGGDATLSRFTAPGNNGYARVYRVTANRLSFDKTQNTMVAETNTARTVQLFVPDLIKNEANPALIVTKTIQFERRVVVGFEYLLGSHANEMTINMATADKITLDLSFVSFGASPTETRKPGVFPAIRTASEAFNTTSDVVRIRASKQGSAAPLFGFVQEMSLSINNNVEPLKAIGVLGAFDASIGDFEVTGDITAYFNDIEAVQAVRNSDSLSIDFALAFDNQGWVFDVPLFTGSNGLLNVEKDAAITIPLGIEAAEDQVLKTTLIACWFPYLPSLAMVA